jgi:hypothetical protein
MRDVPEELAARIESGAATLCHAWRVVRADGTVVGFTDHDRDLEIDGLVHRAAEGWSAGAAEAATGLAAGSQAAGGVLGDGIDAAEVESGAFDGAQVELWRVDWLRPDLKVRLWVGTLARVRRDGDGFRAELEGPLAALERVVGRTYGRGCDAVLGDGRCGVDLEAHPGVVCDKRWETCRGVFGNQLNFRGFPDIPGDDFLTAHPAGAAVVDGGSRRR